MQKWNKMTFSRIVLPALDGLNDFTTGEQKQMRIIH